MYDSILHYSGKVRNNMGILEKIDIKSKKYALATIHRAENTDNPKKLKSILAAFENISKDCIQIVMPIHPRTKKILKNIGFTPKNTKLINPVSYLEMIKLEKESKV